MLYFTENSQNLLYQKIGKNGEPQIEVKRCKATTGLEKKTLFMTTLEK
jgi:hypothetical protein